MTWPKDLYWTLKTVFCVPLLTIEYNRKTNSIIIVIEDQYTNWIEEQKKLKEREISNLKYNGNVSLSDNQTRGYQLSLVDEGSLSYCNQTNGNADNNKNDLDKVVDEAYWKFRAIGAGVLPKMVVTSDSEYHRSIRYDRSDVDRWIEEQKLLEIQGKKEMYEGNVSLLETKGGELSFSQEGKLSLVEDNKTMEEKSLFIKLRQLYQAARQYLTR